MTAIGNPLASVLRAPREAGRFSDARWNLLLRQARCENMVARLGFLLADAGLSATCPTRVLESTRAAGAFVDFQQVQQRREIRRVVRALAGIDSELVLLKGAAYMALKLPLARGRHMADIDILVPRTRLEAIEERLLEQGWEHQMLDSYDQRYYREWMHEIPPLRHPQQGIEIDIHHALLPLTARVRPDPALLWAASIPLDDGRLRVLAPPDMLLHSAAHLFYDGGIEGGLRELLDLHQMLGHFGRQDGFWDALPERAARLQATRPLYYALRYCNRLLDTRIPQQVLAEVGQRGAPPVAMRALMDRLVCSVLTPRLPGQTKAHAAAWLLYVRSHWLRMPPGLLATHLGRKAWRKLAARSD